MDGERGVSHRLKHHESDTKTLRDGYSENHYIAREILYSIFIKVITHSSGELEHHLWEKIPDL